MATLAEIASQTTLEGPALAHLQRLVGTWGLLSDLCFADLLLFVPVDDPSSGRFVVLGQIRPTTSQTLYREDQIGKVFDSFDRPLVARAWRLGDIIDGEVDITPAGEVAGVQCIPVRWKDSLLGVLTRESAPSVGRRPGDLERVYVEIFDRFARMIIAGEFPFGAEETEPDEAPRVGDGVARLDAQARVDFASPNFVSVLHRMGIHRNTHGARLGEIGFDESTVRAAFAIGLPITEELERRDVVVLVRCIPFLEHGRVTGAVMVMRDVSDLRRRDRLLISKDATIREIHHRVKNNLQTISSLLRLHARRLDNPEARAALEESVRRVRSIALVHETLSEGASQEVEFDQIVRPLVRMVEEGLGSEERPVRLEVQGDAGELRAEIATPLAVVLTELLQNAVQHGFPTDDSAVHHTNMSEPLDGEAAPARQVGRVVVSFANDGSELLVRVRDDGVGLPDGFTMHGPRLGLLIVRTLVTTDLGGTIDMWSDNGTVVELRVPVSAGTAVEATAPGD
ncbi:MAG: two-component system, sensor histidine kinase PdtaS [Actinomycetota bacterium]|jgi:two-component sensor histidine kinase|nr:two-component system, sensor histidine kinase PdtaS [Actinomycetota bacterium]MEA2972716.1 two-component system, sensor histidine kinase PdtaS [Actinomycetota bacterium]